MKNFKMKVTKAEAAYVQQKCFEAGIYWRGGLSKATGDSFDYLYVDHKLITHGSDKEEFENDEFKEISFLVFLGMGSNFIDTVGINGFSWIARNAVTVMYFGVEIHLTGVEKLAIKYLATDESGDIYGYRIKPVWSEGEGEWVIEGSIASSVLVIAIGECESVTNPELSLMEI